jgi:hypothetical protein
MSTEAYRRHLARACTALRVIVGEILVQVPGEMKSGLAVDPARRLARSEVAEALGRYPGPCASGFGEALEALVEDAQAGPRSIRLDLDSLSIMDDLRAQEEIEVVQAGRLLAEEAGAALHRMQRLEAALKAQLDVRDPSPVGPAAIGRALWRATEHLPLSAASRSEAVRCMARLLGTRLGPLYSTLVDTAEHDEDITLSPEAAPPRAASPAAAPGRRSRSPELVAARRAAIAAERWPRAHRQDDFDVTRPGALVQLMDSRTMALAAAAAASTTPLPQESDGEKIPDLIRRHRGAHAAPDADGPPAAVHLFIGSIFDEIVADPALDREGANWIGRLQGAVLRMAANDPDLLQSHRHPAWALINQLATLFDDEPSQRPPNLDAWLERVMAMLRADPRRERFEAVNRKLLSWRADRARRRLTEMEPSVELLRRHALLEEGVEAARRRLERRLDASRADAAVRRYVSSVWALVCAQETSGGAPVDAGQPNAWDTATDLIWSASPARSRLDAPTLVSMIPDLVERLKEGMGRLGLDPDVQEAWLTRLATLHTRAMHRSAEDAQTDMPLTIDLALEDELPSAEVPAEEPFLLHGLSSPADPLAALAIGDSLALQMQGKWVDVALVWRSDNGHFLLLARPDGRSLSVTRSSLRRLLDEGLARTPDAASALARATNRIADGAG